MKFYRTFLFLTIVAVLSVRAASAQSENLKKLQETYQEELKEATAPIDKQYEGALIRLQKKLISEDRLKDALLIKKEIESLKAGTLIEPKSTSAPEVVTSTETDAPMSGEPAGLEAKELAKDWKGDHEVLEDDGEAIFRLVGEERGTRVMTLPLEDLQNRFPNGMRIRFKYRSEKLEGTGVEIRGEFPGLRGAFTFRNPTLVFDGEWNEYLWPFSDTKEQEHMNFQILVKTSVGTIDFKNIEFLAN